jgi:hypothetical protein
VLHRRRADFPARCPALVTIRVRKDVPSLRIGRLVGALERGFRRSAERRDFRVVHYSVQRGASCSCLRAPQLEKHLAQRDPAALGVAGIDPASSGRWFDGWTNPIPSVPRPAVARAQSWLLRAGWQRHGLIRADEIPGGKTPGMRRARPV